MTIKYLLDENVDHIYQTQLRLYKPGIES
ncbi:hypothetical protein LYNGBM3L_05360 [Moorena producens 3L]|uniref:DUF5615 domain-containing protein n=1 Tax=Moorena producens 3L TaxID=489825 RepID=F4XRW1_9CYAN|nr:hypothetical protein LYNGBM3L_05360 [Moorena producens 3L]